MSDETASPSDPASNPPAESTPRVRRISNPRIKKPAKAAVEAESDSQVIAAPAEPPKAAGYPDFSETPNEPATRGDWPEPEAASSGASSAPENPKRKRRRKKGKGGANSSQNPAPAVDGDTAPPSEMQEPAAAQGQQQQPRQAHQAPRPKLDPELIAKFAWKIYLAEVSEEGVALIGDTEAKELSRRCFRLAEIFMEEHSRRR